MSSKPDSLILYYQGLRRGRARIPLSVLALIAFNCLVGLAFWVSIRDAPLRVYLVTSNGIGVPACLLSLLADRIVPGRLRLLTKALVVTPISVMMGVEFAARTVGYVPELIGKTALDVWLSLSPSFLISAAISVFLSVLVQWFRMRATLERQRREAAELRQSETAARLALLQAQIEPHFLFNTLANVQSLIERDPARASMMLENLNCYLRASLARTRKPTSTLDEELALVEALLRIASIRLGDRLSYAIDVPSSVRERPFVPLLLQPLVENALLHGIEPSLEGGQIRIAARCEDQMLRLDVSDTGVGLGNSTKVHGGVGLANVRERMQSLYGAEGQLSIGANADATRGVTATLLIPIR
ncbi:sensor histidine kinase [Trinickia fusca]|uniref:Sensor histidine kinase n=1 Tax=Trinickia fusca TaxID=2419777 RepID=A0A494XC41_9BURK|nr:sensor histidine kinase [Trinickia fusca]RKP48325.1 sensor histidine kinase [Trinickia fusca]